MVGLSKENIRFIKDLDANNNREWFMKNKPRYELNRAEVIEFADEVLQQLNKIDNIETPSGKKALHRIYRDIRFSKNKTPYKNNWPISFKRATKQLRGSYYLHIEPGNSFVGGGFWGPESKDLKLIRTNILEFGNELKDIINSNEFKQNFGVLKGEKLKVAPKGFDKNHKHIDLLRYKQFLVLKKFTDQQVLSKTFAADVVSAFKAMRPFFNYMSEALTTDANGEPLY